MDKSYNDNIRPLLDLADNLPALLGGASISIPKIATCGMQSHGKSSVLESITHISLPSGDGTITICPIKISLRNSKDEEYARIKFELDKENKYEKIKLEQISEKIKEYQNIVKKENNVKEEDTQLFDRVIQVEVNRKNSPNLTLYDLPGINLKNENISKKSEEINEKFLKGEETTVLLILSCTEEVTNCNVTRWMKNIPKYTKRFYAVITRADRFDKDFDEYMKQINDLKLENPPSIVINKCKLFENLSYEEMQEKEKELIKKIAKIDKYPYIKIGIPELIEQLIKKQKEDLFKTFSKIGLEIKKEIGEKEKILKEYPSPCKSKAEFFQLLDECITKFDDKIKSKKTILKCNMDGNPHENLLFYEIKSKFRVHIKKVKEKISEFFSLQFCNSITNNIIQYNSENIHIIEDVTPYHILLRPKIKDIFSDFDNTINDIFNYIITQINPFINESFGNFESLQKKVCKIYKNYSLKQKNKMLDFYNQIKFLETEKLSTFNISLNDRVINLANHINFMIFGKNKNKFIKNYNDKLRKDPNIINEKEKQKKDEKIGEEIVEKKEIKTEEEDIKKNYIENEKDEIDFEEVKENNEETKEFKIINELTSEVINNSNLGENVKNLFQTIAEKLKLRIINCYNYEKEKKVRQFDYDEFNGGIKIAYREQDIATYNEKIIDENIIKISDNDNNEFIPGFQFINKNKLEEFKKLIFNGDIQIKTATVVVYLIAYLENMLNRNLEMISLGIQKYLYDGLTDDKMIKHITNELHLLDFKECQRLVDIKPLLEQSRNDCQNDIKNLKEALKKISNLNYSNYMLFEDDDDEWDEKDEENKINN